MGGLDRGREIYKGCEYPDTDTRQFVCGPGRHTRVIYMYTGVIQDQQKM